MDDPINKRLWKNQIFSGVAVQPDSKIDYRLVFDIKDEDGKEGVNAGLLAA